MDEKDRDLLVRLDERTKRMEEDMRNFVTHEEFRPIKLIAYGLVSTILLSVFGAILALVLK